MSSTPLPREQFPVADRYRYLDHAGVCAPPTVVAHAIARDASTATMFGSVAGSRRADRTEEVRARCAGLLGVPVDDVAFVKNTTEGLGFVANGLTWAPGDRVVVADREFPSTVFPWLGLRDLGVEVDLLDPVGPGWTLPPERFEEALVAGGGRVRAVVVSWVQFARGWRSDLAVLADLAHRHGAILVADVIQGLGVLPAHLAEWGVDAAMADAHKWLLGPEGIGVLYVDPSLRERLRVLEPGWASVVQRGEWGSLELHLDPSARRFEGGSYNLNGIAALGAAADLLAGAGIDAVWAHVDDLCEGLADGLRAQGATVVSDRSPAGRSAILSATFPDTEPAVVAERLLTHGVVVAARGDAVRFAPHGWNDHDDVAAVLDAVRRTCRS